MRTPKTPNVRLSHVFALTCAVTLAIVAAPAAVQSFGPFVDAVSTASAQQQQPANPDDGEDANNAEDQKEGDGKKPERTPTTCWNDDQYALLQDIKARAAQQTSTSKDLERRRAALKAAEERIDQKTAELRRLKNDIEKRLEKRNQRAREDLQQLVSIYANMRPAKAASVIGLLPLRVAVDVMQRMEPRAAAEILTQMDKENASRLTRMLNQERLMIKGERPIPQGGDNAG